MWPERASAFSRPPALASKPVRLRELALAAQIGLRGDYADPAIRAAIQGAVGIAPPEACRAASLGDTSLLWLGPTELLLTVDSAADPGLVGALDRTFSGLFAHAVDLSDTRTVLELAGPAARIVLAKGCSLDLHYRTVSPGAALQSSLGRAPILIHQVGAEPVYRLFVRRSFARYIADWLEDAAAEYRDPDKMSAT